MIIRRVKVIEVLSDGRAQRLKVQVIAQPDGAEYLTVGAECSALNYPEQLGPAEIGDELLIECSALAKNLGTGGVAMVTANLSRLPVDSMPPNNGHIMKARYTPSQTMVATVEEQDSPYHEVMKQAQSLEETPVVALGLHSQLPAVLAGLRITHPEAKVALVYSDGAALPVAFSGLVAQLKKLGWLEAVISAGQSYGGDYEAINTLSGMLAAKHVVKADVILVGQGPGNAGTATPYGYSGIELAGILTNAALANGLPICALRMSNADFRPRHRGISHHTLNILRRFVPMPIDIALPVFCDEGKAQEELLASEFSDLVREQLSEIEHHHIRKVNTVGLYQALVDCPVKMRTMGRDLDDDVAVFLAAAAAGKLAGVFLERNLHSVPVK